MHLPIENLYLENWSAGSVGIAMAIGRMTRLKKLDFSASKECFRYLSNLRELRELKTFNVDYFSVQELMYISHLPLELIDITGCQSFLEDDMFDLMMREIFRRVLGVGMLLMLLWLLVLWFSRTGSFC